MLSDLATNLFYIMIILASIFISGAIICIMIYSILYFIAWLKEEIQDYKAAHPKSLELETFAPLTYGDIEHIFYEQNPNLQHLHSDYRPCGMNSIVIWFKTKVGIVVRYDEDSNKFEIVKIDKSENL